MGRWARACLTVDIEERQTNTFRTASHGPPNRLPTARILHCIRRTPDAHTTSPTWPQPAAACSHRHASTRGREQHITSAETRGGQQQITRGSPIDAYARIRVGATGAARDGGVGLPLPAWPPGPADADAFVDNHQHAAISIAGTRRPSGPRIRKGKGCRPEAGARSRAGAAYLPRHCGPVTLPPAAPLWEPPVRDLRASPLYPDLRLSPREPVLPAPVLPPPPRCPVPARA